MAWFALASAVAALISAAFAVRAALLCSRLMRVIEEKDAYPLYVWTPPDEPPERA